MIFLNRHISQMVDMITLGNLAVPLTASQFPTCPSWSTWSRNKSPIQTQPGSKSTHLFPSNFCKVSFGPEYSCYLALIFLPDFICYTTLTTPLSPIDFLSKRWIHPSPIFLLRSSSTARCLCLSSHACMGILLASSLPQFSVAIFFKFSPYFPV